MFDFKNVSSRRTTYPQTNGIYIVSAIDDSVKEANIECILVGICTDGACTIFEKYQISQAFEEEKFPHFV